MSAVQGIEILYNICIPDEALPTFKCGNDIISYLEAL
jgi:acyl carrier protein